MADFIGTSGDDNIRGTQGADFFDISQGGADFVGGGPGDDTIFAGNTLDSLDRIKGGDGFDTLQISGESHGTIYFDDRVTGIELITVTGFSGQIWVKGAVPLGQFLTVDASATTEGVVLNGTFGGLGDLTLIGGSGDDTLIGGQWPAGTGTLLGGLGDDRIWSGENWSFNTNPVQPHTIQAGGGDDLITAGPNDTIRAGEGNDTLYFYDTAAAVVPNLHMGSGDDTVNLGTDPALAVLLQGGDGVDTLVGVFVQVGTEFTVASSGFERLDVSSIEGNGSGIGFYDFSEFQIVDGHFDNFFGGPSDDTVIGTLGADDLFGGYGADVIYGGMGKDELNGGDGADVLVGGVGQDEITGGNGADTFIYQALEDSLPNKKDRDTIEGFGTGDKIDLSAIDADTTQDGDQAFHLGGSAFTHVPGELIFAINPRGDATLRGDVDGDGAEDFMIFIKDRAGFQEADFVF